MSGRSCATHAFAEALPYFAGSEIDVIGDGYCWEWALGASLGVLGNALRPTREDYDWASKLLLGAQAHFIAGGLGTELHDRLLRYEGDEGITKFMAVEPAYKGKGLSHGNYCGSGAAYPVVASYLQIPILVLHKPALDDDYSPPTRGPKQRIARPDTRMGEFSLYTPDDEYEQPLSLVGLRQLLQEGDQHLLIVAHNGYNGITGHWTAFAEKAPKAMAEKYKSMSDKTLRKELQARKLNTSGEWEVLMKRLKKADMAPSGKTRRLKKSAGTDGKEEGAPVEKALDSKAKASSSSDKKHEKPEKGTVKKEDTEPSGKTRRLKKSAGTDGKEEGAPVVRASDAKAETSSSSDKKHEKPEEGKVKKEEDAEAAGQAAALSKVVAAMAEAARKGWPGSCTDTATMALEMSAQLTLLASGATELRPYAEAATAVVAVANAAIRAEKSGPGDSVVQALKQSIKAAAAAVATVANEAAGAEDKAESSPALVLKSSCEDFAKALEELQEQPKTEGLHDEGKGGKVSVRRPLTVAELRDKGRWRWTCREGGGWDVWTRESDSVWRQRFEVRESGLMRAAIERNPAYGTESALGLFAARDFEKGEKVGVLVGADLGTAEGEAANRVISDRIAQGGGRHIVEVRRGGSARLLDGEGAAGYTGMQFVNDARSMRGWHNNMEFGEDGTVTALQRICLGTELLFAYDKGGRGGYWKTWGKKGEKTRDSTKQGVAKKKEMAESSPTFLPLPAKQEALTEEQEREEKRRWDDWDDWALAQSLAEPPRCVS